MGVVNQFEGLLRKHGSKPNGAKTREETQMDFATGTTYISRLPCPEIDKYSGRASSREKLSIGVVGRQVVENCMNVGDF